MVETLYMIFSKESALIALSILISYILLFYNSIYFYIELYGVLHYMTRNEIYNNHKYKYLYYPVVDKKGQIIMKRRGPFENGSSNIRKFF